jgi:hypothetical protein
MVFALVSCAKDQVWRPPDSPGYIELEGKKALILPVRISMGVGDDDKLGAALFGGFVAAFGENGIPLQPIAPALEAAGLMRLSTIMASGVAHVGLDHNSDDLTVCVDERAAEMAEALKLLNQLVKEVGKMLADGGAIESAEGFKFDYVVGLSIYSMGMDMTGQFKEYKVFGGVVDAETTKILAATRFKGSTMNDETAFLAEFGTLGGKVKDVLFGAKPE